MMEEEKGVVGNSPGAGISCGVTVSSSSELKGVAQRQRFCVDLRPGETTIVSWKRLIKESNKAIRASPEVEPRSGAHRVPESRIAPEGRHSSDEEDLDDIPDDQYDTDDSFIDDAELDQYFQVDKSATKHNGFFVNRGKLERINEPFLSPIHASKKRRRRYLTKAPGDLEVKRMQKKLVKMGGVRMETTARNATLVGNPSQNLAPLSSDDHFQEGKLGVLTGPSKPENVDSTVKPVPSSDKMPNKDPFAFSSKAKDVEMQKSETVSSKELVSKDKIINEPQPRKPLNHTTEMVHSTKVRHKEKSGRNSSLIYLDYSGSKSPMQKVELPSMMAKEGVRPKGSMLERAIRELEKRVAESRPPAVEVQEADASSQAIKRRLPQDVKLKLAKVARLAQSSQGKISEELINHLMTILGHLVQVKTLKRNMKEMVELGLFAKQQKADRFQQIKREVIEMITIQGPFSPGEREQYKMDDVMEDRLCDLYDLYVEGMDEDKGPQSRKLYVELAELWPTGSMDNHGIKNAVCRAKERRRGLLQKDAEKLKRKKSTSIVRVEEDSMGGGSNGAEAIFNAARTLHERLVTETNSQAFSSSDRSFFPTTSTSQPLATSSMTSDYSMFNGANVHQPKLEKVKRSINSSTNTSNRTEFEILKKKMKRKQEPDMGATIPLYPMKLPSLQQGKEIHSSNKRAVNSSMIQQNKPSPPAVSQTSFEQPS